MRPSPPLRPQTTPIAGGEERSALAVLFSPAGFPYWLALVIAVILALCGSLISSKGRMTNLDLSGSGFPEAYLMIDKTAKDRGYLTNRRDSTIRRSRKNLPGRMWHLTHIDGGAFPGAPGQWLLRSKTQGTVFLVPVEKVDDWLFPFLYGFVRVEDESLDLPPAGWVQLHVNRVYRGLYLKMAFPVDPRRKDGRVGPLRELLSVQGDEMTVVTTRFEPAARIFAESVVAGTFPRLAESPPGLAWLARRRPFGETVFLLGGAEQFQVTLLPLPLSVNRLFAEFQGMPLPPTRDERFRRWTGASWAGEESADPPFPPERRERFETERRRYIERLQSALGYHRRLNTASTADSDPGHWATAASLGLDFEGWGTDDASLPQ